MSLSEPREALLRALRRVAPETDPASLDAHADLRDALDLDSMDFLGVVTALHEELGVDVPAADYPKLRTLADATEYLSRRLA